MKEYTLDVGTHLAIPLLINLFTNQPWQSQPMKRKYMFSTSDSVLHVDNNCVSHKRMPLLPINFVVTLPTLSKPRNDRASVCIPSMKGIV
jgi:hypothetical protein